MRLSKTSIFYLVLVSVITVFVALPIEAKELKWVGCGITKKAFMKELANAYKKKTGNTIILKGGGATKGIRAVAKGLADMGGSCRHTLNIPEESGVSLHQVAWDALVVVVNKNNPINSITTDQLKGILKGTITSWKELGGTDNPVKLYIRKSKNSGVGLMAREMLFNNPGEDFAGTAKMMRSSGPLERAISNDPYGIGITGISSAKKRVNLKMLKINGIEPTKNNIASGKYPFVRPLYLVTSNNPTTEVKEFIEFALSTEGQTIISGQGTVNLKEGKSLGM
ncbi:MAG: phosphate ABC transporter substrate-binding protein [Nitrospirae bacterium]|nr:MAG: phosphate ABC transporter substrate-binding protein [Nitrospirota bacterium]